MKVTSISQWWEVEQGKEQWGEEEVDKGGGGGGTGEEEEEAPGRRRRRSTTEMMMYKCTLTLSTNWRKVLLRWYTHLLSMDPWTVLVMSHWAMDGWTVICYIRSAGRLLILTCSVQRLRPEAQPSLSCPKQSQKPIFYKVYIVCNNVFPSIVR